LYESSYRKIGELVYRDSGELIRAYPLAITLKKKGLIEGALLFRRTNHGLKLGIAAIQINRENLAAFKDLIREFQQTEGWYAEVSGASFKVFGDLGLKSYVPVSTVGKILNKRPIQAGAIHPNRWPPDVRPYVYRRTVIRGGAIEWLEKVMVGRPDL
jgi:hypothetical protein